MRFPAGRIAIALVLIGVIITGVAFYLENRTSPPLPAPTHPSENSVQPSPTPESTPEGPLWSQLGIDTNWPELTPLFEEGKFAQEEAITNSSQELLIVGVSPDISLAETATEYAVAIIPELESLLGIAFGSQHIVYYPSDKPIGFIPPPPNGRPVAAVIYVPLSTPEGEPAAFQGGPWFPPFGKVYSIMVTAADNTVPLSTLIHELAHAFPISEGPLWWIEGASTEYPRSKLYPIVVKKLGLAEEEWRRVFAPCFDPTDPRCTAIPEEYSTPEKWLEKWGREKEGGGRILSSELPPLVELEKEGSTPFSCRAYVAQKAVALMFELEKLIGEENMKGFFNHLCQNKPITNETIIEAAVYATPSEQKEAVEEMFRTYIFGK